MKKLLTLIGALCFIATVAISQRTLSGKVMSADGEDLIGANIIVRGTTVGTVTDFEGKFSLEVPDGSDELLISYTGFQTQTVSVAGLSYIDVSLEAGIGLEEVIVTALGISRDEKSIGYAVQEVSGRTIANANTVSAIDALAGTAAGLQITSSSGAAGAASRIILRGQTSFNGNNEALIVVDGVRLNNDENHSERSLGGVANSNRAIDLNPADIDKVTVLKGAAATALYGIEGARGVILITTKRGKGKGLTVDVSTGVTISEITNVTGLQDQYVQGSNGVWRGPETGSSGSWGPLGSTLFWDGSDYKWDKNGRLTTAGGTPFVPYDNVDAFFGTGVSNTNNLAFSGSNDLTDYRVSFGYTDDNGVAPQNSFTRYNVGMNMGTSMFNDKLDIGFGINYVNSGGRRLQQGSNISGVMLGLLRTTPSFDNTNGLDDPENYSLEDAVADGAAGNAYQFLDGTQRTYRGGGGYDNPFWVANNAPFFDDVNRFFGNFKASYHFDEWANLSAVLGTDVYTDNRIQRYEIGSRGFPGGQVIEDNYNYRHLDFFLSLHGDGNLGESFSLGYNVGLNLYDEQFKQNYIQGDGLNFVGFAELGNTALISSQITHNDLRSAGVYGTLDLGFKDVLYLSLTGRNDWSSTLIDPLRPFNAGDISFFYPSVSMGFVFSDLVNADFLSFGKLRASYAEVGGGAPSPYLTSTSWILPIQAAGTVNDLSDGWTNGIGFPFKGTSGFVINAVAGSPSLKPSRTKDIEVGLDIRFANNRIGVDATLYNRVSEDQIIAINIPNTTGFQRAVVNNGELKTVGGEVVLTLVPVSSDNFSWNIGLNFSKWKTTVESLPEGVPNQYLDGFTSAGAYNIAPETDANGNTTIYEYGQILGGAFQRVNTANGTFDPNGSYNPTGALIIDDNPASATYGFPITDPTQRIIGNPNPDWLAGVTNTLSFKGLSLSFLFDMREGGDIWNGTKGALTFFGMSELTENRGTITVFEGVKSSDGGANDISVELNQAWYQGNGGGFGAVAEHFIEDGSFRRLRYVTLSYDLAKLIKTSSFSALNISVTGRNLFIDTPYTGFDPELSLVGSSSNGQGLDYFQQPGIKSYSVGLSATF